MPILASSSDPLVADAQSIWAAGVSAVNATNCVRNGVSADATHLMFGDQQNNPLKIAHSAYRNLIVVGAGKAVAEMAVGLEQSFGLDFLKQKNASGWLNVPDDKVLSLAWLKIVGCRPPGINLPTTRVLESTRHIIEILQQCDPADLVIFLIAGGGSALLEYPLEPITLQDFQTVTKLLSHRGAAIEQLNAVRRQISQVKGGGLGRLARCRQIVTLLVSDVLGDPLNVIASGPTLNSDSQTTSVNANEAALAVLKQFDPNLASVPPSVIRVLTTQCLPFRNSFATINHLVIANNESAVAAARRAAIELGYECTTETDYSSDRAEEVGVRLSDWLLQPQAVSPSMQIGSQAISSLPFRKRCFISGGEPTVKLSANPGSGGRNQQLVLSALAYLIESATPSNLPGSFCLLAGGTDGEDGNVPVAGAWLDNSIYHSINETDSSAALTTIRQHLINNDAYHYFQQFSRVFAPGSTGTNVCDLRVVLKCSQ